MKLYIDNLQQIFNNIVLLYKNFFHWNISKICVFLYANIVGFIVSLPFVGVILYQYFTSYSKLGLSVSAEEFFLGNIGTLLLTVLLILCIVAIFIATYTYGNFLKMNVYKSYLGGEKIPYTKNFYFSVKHFRTYMGILGWMSLYLLAPILIGLVLIIPIWIIVEMNLGISSLVIGGVSLILFVALLIWFIYLAIRLAFSYYVFLYSEDIQAAKTYINESFRLTKRKVWKIIFLILPFLIALGVVTTLVQTGESILTENRVYSALTEIQKQSWQDDHKLLEGFFNGTDDEKVTFGKIEKEFLPMKDTVNKEFLSASIDYIDVKSIDTNGWIFSSIFIIFSFLVLEGVSSMMYLSIYAIIKNKDEENNWVAPAK